MDKDFLEEKYLLSGKSMFQISKILGCSVHKVTYWMKKHNIKKRSRSEANYLLYNPDGDPFKIKEHLSKTDNLLKGLGLGIYWGEGSKTTIHSLRVANTNPLIIKTFRKFLKDICELDDKRISYSIISFNDVDSETSRSYWAKELKISPEKFGKITQIPKQGKGTYKHKSLYGVCIIQANNRKLRDWLFKELESLTTKPD